MEKISEAVAAHYAPQQPSSSTSASSAAVVMVFKERVLEAIDQLRRRKARPDLQRICNYLFRKYSIKLADARNALQWCCDTHAVRRVEYKGNISYRNATKKTSSSSSTKVAVGVKQASSNAQNKHKIIEKKGKFGELVTETFGELIVFEPDYLEFGVPVDVLIDQILYKENGRYSRKYVTLLLQKEVATGNIIRMANGNYSIANNTVNRVAGSKQHQQPQPTLQSNHHSARNAEIERQSTNSYHSSIDVALSRNHTTANDLVRLKSKKKLSTSINQKSAGNGNSLNRDKKNMDNIYLDDKRIDSGLLRVGGRRKRAKKVFDPSDTHVPKKRGRPLGKSMHEKMNQDGRFDTSAPSNVATTQLFKDGFKQQRSSQQPSGVCCVCHNNTKRHSDSLVVCRECSNRAHLSCLNGDNMMLKMYPDNTWQCPHCKTCCICYETSDAGGLIVCSICADGYHSDCHQPPISDKINSKTNNWVCLNCQASENIKIEADQHHFDTKTNTKYTAVIDQLPPSGTSSPTSTLSSTHMNNYRSPAVSPTPPQLSPQTSRPESPAASVVIQPITTSPHFQEAQQQLNSSNNNNNIISASNKGSNNSSESLSNSENDKDLDDSSRCSNVDNGIPDATHWSPQQVAQYFAQYFPPEVTKVFIEQEIDGRSLLLLKRMDVLNNLNLKLGHAVKVYKHVVMLQVRRDDTNLYWL